MDVIGIYLALSQNKFALVDRDDYDELSKYKWYFSSHGYARRRISRKIKKELKEYLHRFIIKAKKGEIVDHINRDTLDNRKCNLRITTQQVNMRNRKSNARYGKGIRYHKKNKRYYAYLSIKGKTVYLGSNADLNKIKLIRQQKLNQLNIEGYEE